jgi:hypothetical protein
LPILTVSQDRLGMRAGVEDGPIWSNAGVPSRDDGRWQNDADKPGTRENGGKSVS